MIAVACFVGGVIGYFSPDIYGHSRIRFVRLALSPFDYYSGGDWIGAANNVGAAAIACGWAAAAAFDAYAAG